MLRWEYDFYDPKGDASEAETFKRLDEKGAEGWELVGITRKVTIEGGIPPQKVDRPIYVFKRTKPGPPP